MALDCSCLILFFRFLALILYDYLRHALSAVWFCKWLENGRCLKLWLEYEQDEWQTQHNTIMLCYSIMTEVHVDFIDSFHKPCCRNLPNTVKWEDSNCVISPPYFSHVVFFLWICSLCFCTLTRNTNWIFPAILRFLSLDMVHWFRELY